MAHDRRHMMPSNGAMGLMGDMRGIRAMDGMRGKGY